MRKLHAFVMFIGVLGLGGMGGTPLAFDAAALAAAEGAAPAFTPIAPKLEVPQGKAMVLRLSVPEAVATKQAKASATTLGTLLIHVVSRGDQLRAFASVPQWHVAPLPLALNDWKAEAGSIAFEATAVPGQNRPIFTAKIQLGISGQNASGKATITDAGKGRREAAVTGTWRDAEQEAAANPFAADRDWPTHNGRGGLCAAVPIDRPVVDKGTDMRLAWVSEVPVPYTAAGNARFASSGTGQPIVYEGNVYVCWYRPSGDVLDEKTVKGPPPRELPPGYTAEDLARVSADDLMASIDAATGLTRWVFRVPGAAASRQTYRHKGFPGTTPGAADGVVIFTGMGGRVYCIDAKTGAMKWQNLLGTVGKYMQAEREKALAEKQLTITMDRHYVIWVEMEAPKVK